jgi:transposase
MATRSEWIERVKRWDRSGLDAAEFAQRERLKLKQLQWWSWKLRASESPPLSAEPRFLPVRVVTARSMPAEAPISATTTPIEIALGNGRVVRVRPGFDPATLERVLAIAAEEVPC